MTLLTIGLLLGSLQGILISLFLFVRSFKDLKSVFLSAYVFVFSLTILFPALIRYDHERFIHVLAGSFPLLLLVGPFLFLYIKSLIGNWHSKWMWMHGIPSLMVLFYLASFYTRSRADKMAFFAEIGRYGTPAEMMVIWASAVIHILVYQWISMTKLQSYAESIKAQRSSLDLDGLHGAQFLIHSNLILWVLYLIFYLFLLTGIFSNPFGVTDILFGYLSKTKSRHWNY